MADTETASAKIRRLVLTYRCLTATQRAMVKRYMLRQFVEDDAHRNALVSQMNEIDADNTGNPAAKRAIARMWRGGMVGSYEVKPTRVLSMLDLSED